jgi:squalene-hopene/tetraprenyl-beta-curcumene cyclase
MQWTISLSAGCVLAAAVASGGDVTVRGGQVPSIDAALGRSARYLVSKQSRDGAWRSETYGCLREGPALTAYVMSGLFFLPQDGDEPRAAFRKGVQYLVGMVGEDGTIRGGPHGFSFPLHTATMASRVVVLDTKSEENRRAQTAWLTFARRRQLGKDLGWDPADLEYGGWGFSTDLARKPAAGEWKAPFVEANLSATLFGIAALRSVRVPLDDPAWQAALVFVQRCQNFSDDPAQSDPRFDDGGFYFMPGDALQNKAGVAGRDRTGHERYHSYGSMTADGLRALLQCGLKPDHPRVAAARAWLERNFTAETHPGRFSGDREVLREATYYYYVWSASHAFTRLGITKLRRPSGELAWAEVLAAELIRRQRPDGSWVNSYTDAKEDDPLVATPWAAAALAVCREVLSSSNKVSAVVCPVTGRSHGPGELAP